MSKILSSISRISKVACRNPKDLFHIFGVADSAARQISDPDGDTRMFPKVDFSSILDESCRFTFEIFRGVGASITLTEAAALAALIKLSNAKRVFEFGTYKGVSTTQIALNLPEDGVVYTLDLPDDHPVYLEYTQLASESGMKMLVPADQMHKVKFLKADSAQFDTSPYRQTMDLVFVDGYHSYEYVKNDTEKAFEMLRPGGIIAWHDCEPNRPEVVRYLRTITPLPHLVSSSFLAFAVKPA
jgi:predicted O-methyltransferase YrrM